MTMMQKLWELGMNTEDLETLGDRLVVFFELCFNGLRNSMVLYFKEQELEGKDGTLDARPSIVKRKVASCKIILEYHRISDV